LDSNKEVGLHTFRKSVLPQFETAPEGIWLSPFLLPLNAISGDSAVRLADPKSLTTRLGAQWFSIYGGTSTAKTTTLTASSKDPVRESHARDLMAKPFYPKIIDEDFPEFQTLLDSMEVEATPITMPSLPSLGPSPSLPEQNERSRVNLHDTREGDAEDTCASSTGTHHATRNAGFADMSMHVQPYPTRQGSPAETAELILAYAITAFLVSPLLPDLDKLLVDHISALMAVAVDGNTHKAAMWLLALEHSKAVAEKVWAA
jgi:non-ribosomal peptide synthetase component F